MCCLGLCDPDRNEHPFLLWDTSFLQLCHTGPVLLQVPKYFGLEDSEMPAIAIHEAATDSKYFLKNAKPSGVNKWLSDYEV
jgi:hypothetical protein